MGINKKLEKNQRLETKRVTKTSMYMMFILAVFAFLFGAYQSTKKERYFVIKEDKIYNAEETYSNVNIIRAKAVTKTMIFNGLQHTLLSLSDNVTNAKNLSSNNVSKKIEETFYKFGSLTVEQLYEKYDGESKVEQYIVNEDKIKQTEKGFVIEGEFLLITVTRKDNKKRYVGIEFTAEVTPVSISNKNFFGYEISSIGFSAYPYELK